MREIKFRAWDKKERRFLNEDEFVIDNNGKVYLWNENNTLSFIYNIELMQYTGLKDKNGKEIYEGDVVAYDLGFDDEKTENYKIIFDNKQCAYFMFPLNDKSRLRHFTYSAKNDCEVIGNIYENTELLN